MQSYVVLEHVGEGSFGKVFRGRRKYTGQFVALKFVSKAGKSAQELDALRQEIAILRTLGASKQFLLKASVYEYLVLGVLAGGFATLLVEVLLSSLQVRLFELPFQLHPMLWWMGPTLGALIIVSLAMVQLKGLLNMPSAVLLRRALHA